MTWGRRVFAAAALVLALSAVSRELANAQADAEAAPNPDITQVLVGIWQGDLRDLLGTLRVTMKLDRDGSYSARHVLVGGYTVLMRGRWTARPTRFPSDVAGSGGVISFEITESQPEEFCSSAVESNPLTIRDPNTIEFGDGTTNYPNGVMRRIAKSM